MIGAAGVAIACGCVTIGFAMLGAILRGNADYWARRDDERHDRPI